MHLSPTQTRLTLDCAPRQFGADAWAVLFGSRRDTTAGGGDFDLLVRSAVSPASRQLAFGIVKVEVIASVRSRPLSRTARYTAAHDGQISYDLIAERFNELQALQPVPVGAAAGSLKRSAESFEFAPATADFGAGFFGSAVIPQVCRHAIVEPR